MKALILAAGLGSRLFDLTRENPKSLVQVNGKPVLGYQLEALSACDVAPVGITVGHAGEKIIEFVKRFYPKVEARFFWNRDYDKTNSSYSFWMAREWVEDETHIHLNCDILFSSSLLRRLIDAPTENIIAIRRDIPLGDKMENVILRGDRIINMSLTNTPLAVGKAFGLAKLGPASTRFITTRIASHLKEGDRTQNYFGIIREALHHVDYQALDASPDLLLEVNTLDDLGSTEQTLKKNDAHRAPH